ncbi:divergent PAP2 family protein [Dysosmobacter sp.]
MTELYQNQMLIKAMAAWLTAQIIKTVIYAVVNGKVDMHRLFGDGGMPSGHSATVTALAVSAGMEYGFSSGVFAIAAVLAVIVMHDAMSVRLEAGKHAKAINELLALMGSSEAPDIKLKELLGHTPIQVCSGAVLGLLIAVLF